MDDASLIVVVSAASGLIMFIAKLMFKSKCSRVECCCIRVDRNTTIETDGELGTADSPQTMPPV